MVILTVFVGVLAGAVVAGACTLVGLRALRRQAAVERDAAVQAALTSVSADREAAVRAAVDTVLAVAGEKFSDHRAAATQELDLRSETIARQVTGMQESFAQRVDGLNHSLAQQLAGVNDELARVTKLVADLQRERASQHSQVVESITNAARQTANLGEVTQNLREALASSRARGQWGERMADDVLRAAGFVEGVQYRKQQVLPGGTRPDVTFLLPNDRQLHMDVKFPIDNYLRYLEAQRGGTDPATVEAHRAQFLKDVRLRIKEVTTRDYVDPDTTLGYVLLFIPNEAVYGFVHEADPGLIDVALGQRVVLCSPFTLFAVLGVIRQAVESVQLQRTSDEILRCLVAFSGQWSKFSDTLDVVGKRFDSTQKAFDDLRGTRRRQLQKTLDEVDRLREARGIEPATDPAATAAALPAIGLVAALDDHDLDDHDVVADRDRGVAVETSVVEQRVAEPVAVNGGDVVAGPADEGRRVPRLRPIRGR